MELDTLVHIFAALGLLPPSAALYSGAAAAPPLDATHIEPAGTGSGMPPAMTRRLRRVQPISTSDASASASDASPGTAEGSNAPLTAADMAGPVARDAGLQDLTPAEMAGPVARTAGANQGATDGGPGSMMKVLQSLGFFTSDGNFNTLGVLGAALNGAAALGGAGGQAPPRIAPAWTPGGTGAPLGFVSMLPARATPVQVPQIPAALLRALGFSFGG